MPTPRFDEDLWSEALLLDPYPAFARLREAGAAVWLPRHDTWAITRHAELKSALLDSETFSSARGCSMNAAVNGATANRVMLCTDGRRHRDMRHVFTRPLVPAAVATLRERLRGLAEARLDELVARGRFDGVADLAHYLPLTVVTELVGFNEEGRRQMLRWAAAMFDSMGPEGNTRTLEGLAITGEMFEYIATRAPRSSLDPAGWGAALFAAADRGELAHADAQSMLIDYLGPALDTTIHGTSAALWLFARHPEQWQALRAEPALIPGAINEVLRLESPIRAFTRHATRDVVVDGTLIPAGARVLMLYACANRDGRRYADPEAFDIRRNAADHLAFGQGAHACAGMHLARLEIGLLLEGLARRVAGFELHAAQRAVHNTLRGFASLDLSVRAA